MRIKAKITPSEKATNRRENQKYTSCSAKGMIEWNTIGMYIRNCYFNGKINTVISYDYILND
jgi:hypothetical protein